MSIDRYRAVVALTYPAVGSLKKVIAAGGLSKLTPEQRDKLTMKRVKAGALADDIPEKSIKWLLKQGLIKNATESSAPKRKGKK
jgi:hypothetical protein